jgi:D-methionine transport system substrate-binding protein
MIKTKNRRHLSELLLVVLIFILSLIALSGTLTHSAATNKKIVSVGVIGSSDLPIWQQINRELASQHIYVDVKVFSDGEALNRATAEGQIDINSFQHYAFLHQENQQKHYHLVAIGNTYIQPLNLYSKKIKHVADFKWGDTIAIPNDPTNAGRALKVLEKAGLIQTNPSKGYSPTLDDIISNPKHLKILEVDSAAIIKLLPNFAAGITNANYAAVNHLNPQRDAIYAIQPNLKDPYNQPWINILVTGQQRQNDSTFKHVVAAYHTKAVAQLIQHRFRGVEEPAFRINQ